MDDPGTWERPTPEQQAWIRAQRDKLLEELGYSPLREPPLPELSGKPYAFADELVNSDIKQIELMYSVAARMVRDISPDEDLYELGLREVGESASSAASRLAVAQKLIQRGTVVVDYARRALHELDQESHNIATLDDEWRAYIAAEEPRRERMYQELRAFEKGEPEAVVPLLPSGEPLRPMQAGTLAHAYAMDVIALRQTLRLDYYAQILDVAQNGLDDLARTINDAGAYVLGEVIRRMRRGRAWALWVRRTIVTLASLSLVWVGVQLEESASQELGQSIVVLACCWAGYLAA